MHGKRPRISWTERLVGRYLLRFQWVMGGESFGGTAEWIKEFGCRYTGMAMIAPGCGWVLVADSEDHMRIL